MGKDKSVGFVIMLFGILLIMFYVFWGPLSLLNENGKLPGLNNIYQYSFMSWKWSLVIPMTLAIILFGLLAAWIGFSMVTTPPPVPLSELEEELEAEEAAARAAAEGENISEPANK